MKIATERLILRNFYPADLDALYLLLKDKEVNTFLPWFPVKNIKETEDFYHCRIENNRYFLAICQPEDNFPIGYVKADTGPSHDFGFALRREFWHRGIVTEAGKALIKQLKREGVSYITATHDINNPRSGGVMRQLGMLYCYSYEEQWQPKNFLVTFRMYQLNLDGCNERVYREYWDTAKRRFIEKDL